MTTDLNVVWISDLPPDARVALAQRTDDILTAAVVDSAGALQVAWVEGLGAWHGPLPVGPAVLASGSAVALAKQTDGMLTAVAIGSVAIGSGGVLHVAWVDSTGNWRSRSTCTGRCLSPRSKPAARGRGRSRSTARSCVRTCGCARSGG